MVDRAWLHDLCWVGPEGDTQMVVVDFLDDRKPILSGHDDVDHQRVPTAIVPLTSRCHLLQAVARGYSSLETGHEWSARKINRYLIEADRIARRPGFVDPG